MKMDTSLQTDQSLIDKAINAEDQRKVRLAKLICYISALAFPIMGLIAFVQKNYVLVGVDLIGLVIMLSLLVHIHKTQQYTLTIQVGAMFFAFLCMYLFLSGGVDNSAFVWFYVYPLIGAFLLGAKRGAVVSLTMLTLALIYAVSPLRGLEPFAYYSDNLLIRFFPSMLVVIFFSYLAERTREQAYANVVALAGNLYEEKQRVEQATQSKSEFLANMSHEIRTPMTAIIGMTALTLKTSLNDYQHKLILAVKKSSDGLLALLNDILDFSKIEAGQLEIDNHPFLLSEMLDSVQMTMQVAADEKGLKLVFALADDVPVALIGDELRLQQVLLNLVNNAIKFTPHGAVTIKITAADLQQGDEGLERILFMVSDTGIGIPLEKKESIFSSFSQSDTSTARQYGGTGLGLAISKQLVGIMGGRIWLESTEGKGSTFSFDVLLRQNKSADVGKQGQQLKAELKPLSILVAEDNPLNQELVRLILTQAGHQIELAVDGLESLYWLTKKDFDIVLMDVQMPNMDGIDASQIIRNAELGFDNNANIPVELAAKLSNKLLKHHLPIVAMTANAMKGDREACLEAGMDDYLTKPFQPEQVHTTLARVAPLCSKISAG